MTDEPKNTPKNPWPLRWLSLAELVGLAALVIAVLGYLDSHRERVQQDRERAVAERQKAVAEAELSKARAEEAQREALKHALVLTGIPAGGVLRLQPSRPEQVIQTQTLWFPKAVRADSVATTGNPRIEVSWIEDRLRRAVKPDDRHLPVAIETTFIEDGQTRDDRAVYWIGFSLHGRLIGGPRVELEGLALAKRGVEGNLQAAVDSAWSTRP